MPRTTQEINPVIGHILEIFSLGTPTQLAELLAQQMGLKKASFQVLMSNIKTGKDSLPRTWEEPLVVMLQERGGGESAVKKLRDLFRAQKVTVSPKSLRALASALEQAGSGLSAQDAVRILQDLEKIEAAGKGRTPEAALAAMAAHLIKPQQ